jgi:hypothetical protein
VSNFEQHVLASATASAACNLRTSRISSDYNELRRIQLAPGLISATVVAATWHFWQISMTLQLNSGVRCGIKVSLSSNPNRNIHRRHR